MILTFCGSAPRRAMPVACRLHMATSDLQLRDIATKPSYLHIRKWRDGFVFGPWIDDRGPARGAEKSRLVLVRIKWLKLAAIPPFTASSAQFLDLLLTELDLITMSRDESNQI
jgi:hypothetical protein